MPETRIPTFNPDFQMKEASGLVEQRISHQPDVATITLTVHADSVTVRHSRLSTKYARSNKGGGKRHKINGYTPASRRRQRKALAKLADLYTPGNPLFFITLTLPDDVPHDAATAKRFHQRLFQHMQRKFGPQLGEHWRQHITRRKSGEKIGQPVPHLHSLLLNIFTDAHLDGQRRFNQTALHGYFLNDPQFRRIAEAYEQSFEKRFGKPSGLKWRTNLIDAFRLWLSWEWYVIVSSEDESHLFAGTNVQRLSSRSEVKRRIHYLARDESEAESEPTANGAEMSASMPVDDDPLPNSGRHWGERGKLDRTPSIIAQLNRRQFIRLRRLIVAFLRSKGGKARTYAAWIMDQDRRAWLHGVPPGFTVLGLGNLSHPLWQHIAQSTIGRMLASVLGSDLHKGVAQ